MTKESMHVVNDLWNSLLTYITAAGAFLVANQAGIVSFLGFVLLVARLVHDLPKAYKSVRGWFTKKKPDDDYDE